MFEPTADNDKLSLISQTWRIPWILMHQLSIMLDQAVKSEHERLSVTQLGLFTPLS